MTIRIRVNKKKTKKLFAWIDIVLFAVLIVSGVLLAITLVRYEKNRSLYAAAAREATVAVTPVPTADPALLTPAVSATPAPPKETPPIGVDFEKLKEDTTRVKGWIYSTGTVINYPVVLGTNNEYYLTHAYDGTRDKGGAIFLDCRTTKTLADQNLIVYGRHMKNDAMFGTLMEYQKQDYYESHPYLYFLTPDQNYKLIIFAARMTKNDAALFPTWFESDGARETFYARAVSQSTVKTEVPYRDDVQMMSLVTCSYYSGYEDAKFQVHGWLVPME